MKNFLKPFFRGTFSGIQIFRELVYFLNKESLNNRYLIVKLRNCDCYLLVDTSDSWGTDVLRFGVVETPEDKFVKKIIKNGNTVLDIGAHWGGFSTCFGNLVGEKGKVYSFEASRRNFSFLRKNIKINRLEGIVESFNFAVGEKEGYVELTISEESSGHNSIVRKNINSRKKETVKQIYIDKFIEENNINRVDFIKIDVEGYELNVLMGMETLLKRSKDLWLFIEFSPMFMRKEDALKLYELLQKNFKKTFIAHQKKVYEVPWEEALKISMEKGQRNLFLYK
ncbi:methyltransferase, FkbM family [Persephonella hydrogeniphila]|uniref:Methyltransferase, FkbM family n=1 Tax=Persephonella hydrogeniphila TaxID=198703 RepID=A0A285NM15_9AQUI|nr:FkbM family methyltransferase [Persephonella hydrogeniphila]SNZ10509.1 methyltransferase, FkbM family [Persephonella hydrogeniphila]